ncbi:HEPN domain-containing protein [Microcoleus sp. C2C3]|uniref:HEPN domain-containing protein n=1 Tax=unclassified Microcoleus TaxID=2642155 RepID=UPI002FD58495
MTDTYDRRVQLGASRHRLKDAQALHQQKRWSGAMYLGGYAIECSLKSLICYEEGPKINNFKETSSFKKKGLQGSDLHNLIKLLECLASLQRDIKLDRTNSYQEAWNTITSLWRNDELRYSDKLGDEKDSRRFLEAVEKLHQFILVKQGKSS